MALIRDYEIPGTGVTVTDAYHVVTNVKIEKRIADIKPPADSSRSDGQTADFYSDKPEVDWKAGYIGTIAVTVWKDKDSRNNDARPLGFLGVNPTDNAYDAFIGSGDDYYCKFFIDINSTKNDIEQAYDHLLTTNYYQNAVKD